MAVVNSINAKKSRVKDFCLGMLGKPTQEIGDSVSGVYVIFNKITMQAYIGQSSDVARRWYQHKVGLRSGAHHNKKLQSAWALYGENAFSFLLFAEVDSSELSVMECSLISDLAGQCYNGYSNGLSQNLVFRVSPEQKAKVEQKGVAWLRGLIDAA